MLADLRNLSNSADDISYLLNSLGMDEKKDIIIDQYSHGMKQKLSLASALIGNPETIILDEALNGLDPMSLINMKKKLKELSRSGSTVLLSSHSLELVENLCQQIMILNKGKLVRQISQKDLRDIKEKEGKEFSDYFIELIK